MVSRLRKFITGYVIAGLHSSNWIRRSYFGRRTYWIFWNKILAIHVLILVSNLRADKESNLDDRILTSEYGYFQIPNSIFNLKLPPNELLVLFNLIRRADKTGECYPSIPRIGRDTGIKSENTVRKALRGIMNKKLVRRTGRTYRNVHIMKITPSIYQSIIRSSEKNRITKNVKRDSYINPSIIEVVTPSNNDLQPHEYLSTKEEKNEYPFFKENKKGYSTNSLKKNSFRRKCNKNDNDPSIITKLDLEIPVNQAKRILGEFGIKENNQQGNPLYYSNLDPKQTKDAIDELERIKTINMREHPKVYENNLDPFDI